MWVNWLLPKQREHPPTKKASKLARVDIPPTTEVIIMSEVNSTTATVGTAWRATMSVITNTAVAVDNVAVALEQSTAVLATRARIYNATETAALRDKLNELGL
jgi:hypothetical protein